MANSKKDRPVTKKMNVTFKDKEEYKKFVSGKTHSDKGIRNDKGKYGSQPDIEEIDESELDYDYCHPYTKTSESSEENEGLAVALLRGVLEGAIEGIGNAITETLSDDEKRAVLISVARDWVSNRYSFAKRKWSGINKNNSKGNGNKKVLLRKNDSLNSISVRKVNTRFIEDSVENETFMNTYVNEARKNKYRETISKEEARQIMDQIEVLSILLADRISKLSNACIREGEMSSEEYLAHQNTIEELTTKKVLNAIHYML